jgi:phosphoglycerate dehydrogenase-like enzyme
MPEIKKVLVTVEYDEENLAKLLKALEPAEVILCSPKDDEKIRKALAEVDAAILGSDLDERFFHAPNLKWVHCDHAGLNKSMKPEVFDKGILLSSSAGLSSPALAEHNLMFMLNLSFHTREYMDAQRSHQWGVEGQDGFRCLYGKTVSIIGIGNNGMELARRVSALEMRVLGYGRRRMEKLPGFDEQYSAEAGDSIDPLLRQSDFVALNVPLTNDTYHMITARELSLMKPTAYLINMARGPVVDERALIEALRTGEIAGAGLDVFDNEPLEADSPLWDMPNVYITPHCTPQVPSRTGRSLEIIIDNISCFRRGEPLRNQQQRIDIFTKA